MREIKFRAWDKKENSVYLHNQIFQDNTNGLIEIEDIINQWDTSIFCPEFMKKYNIVLMQYTSLKDKNGKEIYEGDIISATGTEEDTEYTGIRMVKWSKDLGWCLAEELKNDFGLPLTWGGWESVEVIGNIYENPNLLK